MACRRALVRLRMSSRLIRPSDTWNSCSAFCDSVSFSLSRSTCCAIQRTDCSDNESQESLSEQSVRWMAQQVERLKEKLTESQNALQEFQVSEGLINLEDMRSLTSARLQAMSAQVADAQRRY